MVAAGASALMTAPGEGGTSKVADNTAIQEAHQLNTGDTARSKTNTSISRRRDCSITPNKTAPIRETKASRLRAASIVSPTDSFNAPRRAAFSENTLTPTRGSPHTSNSSLSSTPSQKSPVGSRGIAGNSGIPQIVLRDRERYKQQPLSKVSELNKNLMDSNAAEKTNTRRSKKLSKSSSQSTHPSSSMTTVKNSTRHLYSNHRSPSSTSHRVSSFTSTIGKISPSYNSTEVLQRVDALTALTKATMERVERLTSSSSQQTQLSSGIPTPKDTPIKSSSRLNPLKLRSSNHYSEEGKSMSILNPVSILKHKSTEQTSDFIQNDTILSNPLPTVAFKLEEDVRVRNKKHGILKKRCSLDENEILRRSCNSPDSILIRDSETTNNDSEFRPILKYERRSSLDDLAKAKNSDPQNPPSILKRKWLRSGEDEHREELAAEPQGILKKSSQNIADAVAKSLGVTWTEPENLEQPKSQEVRPILKKKVSHDESSSSDPPSLEPRPILKKKSSTESDEHDEKPRKTILKYSSRKNSEDSSNECETVPNSPRKLSVLKQNSLQRRTNSLPECDTITVKPILKNSRSRSIQSTSPSQDLFIRKRARSVGHERTEERKDWLDSQIVTWEKKGEEGCGNIASADSNNADKANEGKYERGEMVTVKFPEDYNKELEDENDSNSDDNLMREKTIGFNSEEAACRRLDDYSAKLRRDKRLSRRFRDRRAMQKQLSSINGHSSSYDQQSKKSPVEFESSKTLRVDEIDGVAADHTLSTKPIERRKLLKIPPSTDVTLERFCTQPVTSQEVQEAAGLLNKDRNKEEEEEETGLSAKDDSTDPSKLSLAERVALFNRKIATESAARAGISLERTQKKRPFSRFRTQPVTSEEVEDAARYIPNALVTTATTHQRHSSSKLQNVKKHEPPPKSILKSSTSQNICNKSSTKLDSCSELSQELAEGCLRLSKSSRIVCSDTAARSSSGCTVPSSSAAFFSHAQQHTDSKIINRISNKLEKIITINDCDSDKVSGASKVECQFVEEVSSKCFKTMTTSQSMDYPSISIADRLAALKRSGSSDWRRRINPPESLPAPIVLEKPQIQPDDDTTRKNEASSTKKDELLSNQRKLADRLEKLESAAEGWRKRVTSADAVKFSVAGKMRFDQIDSIHQSPKPIFESMGNCHATERKKKLPQKKPPPLLNKDVSIVAEKNETLVTSAKQKDSAEVTSFSTINNGLHEVSVHSVPRADDETFTSFFDSLSYERCQEETIIVTEDDFDFIAPSSERLGSRRTTQVQRRRVSTNHNPLKVLAARTDIKSEYTEVKTGVADQMIKLNNIEKLGKNSSLAVEALAGLASTENFGSISLKNIEDNTNGFIKFHPKDSNVFLILIKGRRHVQVRLVEPVASSINSGDNYILVTKNELYHYIGKYSNVIEKSRATEIAMSIQQNKDLGCRAPRVTTIDEERIIDPSLNYYGAFWKILGYTDSPPPVVIDAGHPDEDELYESAMIDTNVVYEVINGELVPYEKYWGAIPKIKMLDPSKTLIFDFGSEMYIWNGKCAPLDERKTSIKLAESLWEEGYDYSDCSVSPIDAASLIGKRIPDKFNKISMKKSVRPAWCFMAKLTQHMETILFREKFLDWPNEYGIIKSRKPTDEDKERDRVDGKIVIEPPDVNLMINRIEPPVDMVLEGCHLGRGTGWWDQEFNRQYSVTTTDVTVWHIGEYSYSKIDKNSAGQFFSGDSYIIRWMYLITVTGRELSGLPSKHAVEGRDRCAYFIWQGRNSSLNKQGTAALLTVELDKEQGPQIRIVEGSEPAVFLNLFRGRMIIYSGKRSDSDHDQRDHIKAFFCRGTKKTEVSLLQVPYSSRQLRTRGCLLFVNNNNNSRPIVYVWYGKNALPHIKENAYHAAELLADEKRPIEIGFPEKSNVKIVQVDEGQEPEDLFPGGMNRKLYGTINRNISRHTPKLFNFSSVSGEFTVSQVLCPHRDEEQTTPFPFLQEELYQASQPALFLFDNKDELWLWQGWWPDTGSDDQTGSGAIRWQAERRAAMAAALQYWKRLHSDDKKCSIYLVWAGLEPLEFINLFPTWFNRDDVAELNMKDGRTSGEMLSLEHELTRLTQSTYPPAQLLQRPLPEGVDPTSLELYLSPHHFQELLGMNMEEFQKLPAWKQIDIKKKIGLF